MRAYRRTGPKYGSGTPHCRVDRSEFDHDGRSATLAAMPSIDVTHCFYRQAAREMGWKVLPDEAVPPSQGAAGTAEAGRLPRDEYRRRAHRRVLSERWITVDTPTRVVQSCVGAESGAPRNQLAARQGLGKAHSIELRVRRRQRNLAGPLIRRGASPRPRCLGHRAIQSWRTSINRPKTDSKPPLANGLATRKVPPANLGPANGRDVLLRTTPPGRETHERAAAQAHRCRALSAQADSRIPQHRAPICGRVHCETGSRHCVSQPRHAYVLHVVQTCTFIHTHTHTHTLWLWFLTHIVLTTIDAGLRRGLQWVYISVHTTAEQRHHRFCSHAHCVDLSRSPRIGEIYRQLATPTFKMRPTAPPHPGYARL